VECWSGRRQRLRRLLHFEPGYGCRRHIEGVQRSEAAAAVVHGLSLGIHIPGDPCDATEGRRDSGVVEESRCAAFEFFQGTPKLVVPDNARTRRAPVSASKAPPSAPVVQPPGRYESMPL